MKTDEVLEFGGDYVQTSLTSWNFNSLTKQSDVDASNVYESTSNR